MKSSAAPARASTTERAREAELQPPRRNGAVDAHRAPVAAEPDQVEREAHPERVHGAAAREVQRVARAASRRAARAPAGGPRGARPARCAARPPARARAGPPACGRSPSRAHRRMGRDLDLAEQIKSDVATAMKAGDRDRVGALRLVLSELQKAAKDGGADEQAVLRRERKRRRESEAAYRDAGRADLADAEAYEAGLIEAYLPRGARRRGARRAGRARDRRDRRRPSRATWARRSST